MIRRPILRVAALAVAVALPACVDTWRQPSDGAASGGDAGPDEALPAACEALLEPLSGLPRALRVTNARASAIYFNQCAPRYVVRQNGEDLPGELDGSSMDTCENVMENGKPCCGCEHAQYGLGAGASLDFAWSGLAYLEKALREGCGQPAGTVCFQGALPVSPVTLVVRLFATAGEDIESPVPTDPFEVEGTFELGSQPVLEIVVD